MITAGRRASVRKVCFTAPLFILTVIEKRPEVAEAAMTACPELAREFL